MDHILPCGLESASIEIMIAQHKVDRQVDVADDALQLSYNIIAFRDVACNHQTISFQTS